MSGLLVHEWIAAAGGSENVLEAMADAFPDADVQCLWTDAPTRLAERSVKETWLARTPLRHHKALALPFTVPTWRMLSAEHQYEWMLVSSHLFAHHARLRGPNRDIAKYVYVHSPARYIWTPEYDERGASKVIRAIAPVFKRIDRGRAQEPTAIAANSAFVRDRIASAWDRDSVVIHPPVDVERITRVEDWEGNLTEEEKRFLDTLPQIFILGASRFISYKRLDLVISTASHVGLPAVIAGRGPDEMHLRQLAAEASVPVEVVVSPSDSLLWALYMRASVLLFPAIEDFGIIPVEAQALGTPVVTGPVGGQLETFTDHETGIIAASTQTEDLAAAVLIAIDLPKFNGATRTRRFSRSTFIDRIQGFVR